VDTGSDLDKLDHPGKVDHSGQIRKIPDLPSEKFA